MSAYRSERVPARGSRILPLLPIAIFSLAAAILFSKWADIPDRWPIHWGASGQPDQWSVKSGVAVFLPLGVGFAVCCFLELVAFIVRATNRMRHELEEGTAAAIGGLITDLVRLLEAAIAIVFAYVSVILPLFSPANPVRIVGIMIGAILAGIAAGMFRIWYGVRNLKRAGHRGLEGYNGIIYKNENDQRLWVPKMAGLGYTLNFANRWAWPILLLIAGIPILFILFILIRMDF